MANYLKHFPQPLLEDLVASRCVPIIGAGLSRNARMPEGRMMPDWDQLGRQLARSLLHYQYSNALDAVSAFTHEYSRAKLVEALHDLLLVDVATPGEAHEAFAQLPFQVVVTTNFEFLLENSYRTTGRYCLPIIGEDQLAIDSKGAAVRLLKLHGDLHHPNRLIATEEDYDGFLDRYPLLATFLANLLIGHTALFVGYSLDDPDFRQVWQVVKDRLGHVRRPAYTIQLAAAPHVITRYERRGVKVINLPADPNHTYGDVLRDVFRELKTYWADRLLELSTTTEDESRAELSIPKGGRLCYFAVPTNLASFYKAHVYPIAERHGFVPVMAVDVIAPGDSILAKFAALTERAELAVVDIGSHNTLIEWGMLIAEQASTKEVMVIVDNKSIHIPDLTYATILQRPAGPLTEDAPWLLTLERWFQLAEEKRSPALEREPSRLLKLGEFRAAVISAAALVENALQRSLREKLETLPRSLSHLCLAARNAGLLEDAEFRSVMELSKTRNMLVHSSATVGSKDAKRMITTAIAIAERLGRAT